MINENQLNVKQSSLCTVNHLHQDKEHLAACSFKQTKKILNDVTDTVKSNIFHFFYYLYVSGLQYPLVQLVCHTIQSDV